MSGADRVIERFHEALMVGVLAVVVTGTGSAWQAIETPETATAKISMMLVIGLVQSMPGILTLLGIAIAVYRAGPVGLFGAVMEVGGVNRVFDPSHSGGVGLVFVGALLVVLGSFLPWPKIYRAVLSDSGY